MKNCRWTVRADRENAWNCPNSARSDSDRSPRELLHHWIAVKGRAMPSNAEQLTCVKCRFQLCDWTEVSNQWSSRCFLITSDHLAWLGITGITGITWPNFFGQSKEFAKSRSKMSKSRVWLGLTRRVEFEVVSVLSVSVCWQCQHQVSSITASLTACGEDLGNCGRHKVVPRVVTFPDVSRRFLGLDGLDMSWWSCDFNDVWFKFDAFLLQVARHLVANFVILWMNTMECLERCAKDVVTQSAGSTQWNTPRMFAMFAV